MFPWLLGANLSSPWLLGQDLTKLWKRRWDISRLVKSSGVTVILFLEQVNILRGGNVPNLIIWWMTVVGDNIEQQNCENCDAKMTRHPMAMYSPFPGLQITLALILLKKRSYICISWCCLYFPTTLCSGMIRTHISKVVLDWDLWRTLYWLSYSNAPAKLFSNRINGIEIPFMK